MSARFHPRDKRGASVVRFSDVGGMAGRLRDGRDHPEVAPDGARERRDAADGRAPSTDHHGLRQDRESLSFCGLWTC